VVMERGGPWTAYGVVTRKFGYRLVDQGRVLGIKFRPGGFHPFLKSPLSRLTDRAVPLSTIPGAEAADSLAREVAALDDEPCRIARVEAFLRAMQPQADSTLELIGRVVDRIVDHREITRLDEAVAGMGVTPRTLQRMFNRCVGVSPAWVIRRYRLIEAADEVAAGGEVNFSRLAIRLGYFDQAHFINHFRDLVGQAPAEYARAQA
jgi:AraC-like DNA-binding protein